MQGCGSFRAAAREALEETGLIVHPDRNLGTLTTTHEAGTVRLHLVVCESNTDDACTNDPAVVEVAWKALAEIRLLSMPPANREILDRLAELDRP